VRRNGFHKDREADVVMGLPVERGARAGVYAGA